MYMVGFKGFFKLIIMAVNLYVIPFMTGWTFWRDFEGTHEQHFEF